MHPPQKTSILYTAPSDPTSRLQPLCEALRQRFQDAGFLIEDTRPLKLHATLVNTIYVKSRKKSRQRKEIKSTEPRGETANTETKNQAQEEAKPSEEENDRSQGHGPDAKAPLRIDARDILDKYKDFVWAENVVLGRIAICEMGAKRVLNERGEVVREEYREVASMRLPGA